MTSEDTASIAYKRRKIPNIEDESNPTPSNHRTCAIFKLNSDCFEKVFDYLSLKDLHSLGETCKDMQQHTGDFFQLNYAANQNDCTRSGVCSAYYEREARNKRKTYVNISGFNRFMRNFSCSLIGLHFHYIKWHFTEFESVDHIYMQNSYLNFHKYFKVTMSLMLKNVEIVQLRNCTIDTDLYDVILSLCEHLRRLYIQDAQLGIPKNAMVEIADENEQPHDSEISTVGYPWLQKTYSMLEHLELMPRNTFEIDELCTFFGLNPTIRSFSTSTPCLWANRQKLLRSNIHLDVLEIKFYYDKSHPNMENICELLKRLYEREFYKELHFYFHYHKEITDFQYVFSLDALVKLFIDSFDRSYNFGDLNNLKEIAIGRNCGPEDLENLAKHLKNLERLDLLRNATSEHIMPFIRHSVNLMKIRLGNDTESLELKTFNEERTKLINARTITIYIPDNIYLKMKWTYNYGETNFNAIKIKRTTSYDWNHHYVI